jgi:hypothetical protein
MPSLFVHGFFPSPMFVGHVDYGFVLVHIAHMVTANCYQLSTFCAMSTLSTSPTLTDVSKHLLAEGKNFLHGGGRSEPNGPTVAERLLKLFIFL